jgi:hypothetical protein
VSRIAWILGAIGISTIVFFAAGSRAQGLSARHIVFLPAGPIFPLHRSEDVARHLERCLALNIRPNEVRDTAGGAMLFLETGFAIAAALSPPAALFVEPSRTGKVFATLGDEKGLIGVEFRLVEAAQRPQAVSMSDAILAIEGGTTLGEHGSLEFSRELGLSAARILRVGSPTAVVEAVRDGRATQGVVVRRLNESLPGGFSDLQVVRTRAYPTVAIARTMSRDQDDGARIEACLFGFRFGAEDARALGGADRFVPLDPRSGLDFVRKVVRSDGGRVDRWNYRAVTLSWR